jgi:diketogulonate reductase-like aldo/keto reductase
MKAGVKLNTGRTMPQIGFGTWHVWPNGKAKRAVTEAIDVGYRLIDTAKIYLNERGVGQAIRASGVPREDIFVTTKLWNGDQGYRSALRAFDASLKRLGLDYVDLYLIHWPVTGKRQASWKALRDIAKSGRAKAVGVSNFTVEHLEELLAGSDTVPAVNQVEFHPFLYKDQAPLLDFCGKHRIVVEAYSPLAHGYGITDPLLAELAHDHKKSAAQVMLRWAIQHGTIPIPKSTDPVRMRENLDIFDFELSAGEMERIDGLSRGLRTCWDPSKLA